MPVFIILTGLQFLCLFMGEIYVILCSSDIATRKNEDIDFDCGFIYLGKCF